MFNLNGFIANHLQNSRRNYHVVIGNKRVVMTKGPGVSYLGPPATNGTDGNAGGSNPGGSVKIGPPALIGPPDSVQEHNIYTGGRPILPGNISGTGIPAMGVRSPGIPRTQQPDTVDQSPVVNRISFSNLFGRD